MKAIISLGVLFIALVTIVNAQTNNPKPMRAEMRSQYMPGAVTLRWAPTDFKTWEWGIAHGYKLTRRTFKLNGQPVPPGETVVSTLLVAQLKPLNLAQFQVFVNANQDRDWPVLAAGTVYGEGFKMLDADTASIYDVIDLNTEQQNRFTYSIFAAEQDLPTAKAMGWAFVDSTAVANAEYRYEISLVDATSAQAKPTAITVTTNATAVLPKPRLSVMPGDRVITLRWEKDELEKHYNSYLAERSADNGATWVSINSRPIVFVSSNEANKDAFFYEDSVAQNNMDYKYRIKGMSSFGSYGPTSDPAIGQAKNGPAEGITISLIATVTTDNKIALDWVIPTEAQAKISYFRVLRAPDIDKPYVAISANLPATQGYFNDPSPGAANYYIIEATDIHNHPHRSIAMVGQPNDATPPQPPPAPVCTCDSVGNVRIHWARSPSNDVMGYRIFRGNIASTEEMQQITPNWIRDTFYRTTVDMNTLSENTYYRVRATDYRENISVFSAPCTAARPDVIPPAPPVIASYKILGQNIEFLFTASNSQDVVKYRFLRRLKDYLDWEVLTQIPANSIIKPYTDSTANISYRYEYCLVAVDEVNRYGASPIVEVKPYDNMVRGPILNLVGVFPGLQPNTPPKAVGLGWDYANANNPDLMGFQIMRGVAGNPMINLHFMPLGLAQASDFGFPVPIPGQFAFVDTDAADFRTLIAKGMVAPFSQSPTGFAITPGATGVGVIYGVYAKYTDGAMSEIATVVLSW